MQPQVSGLVRAGDELGGREPSLGTDRDHGERSCGSGSLRGCALCPSLQGRHSPDAGTPLSLELGRSGEVSPSPGHAGLFLAGQGQRGVPCPGAEQGWRGVPRAPALVLHPPCPRCHAGSPMPSVPSLLSLLRDRAGQEELPAQSPLHPNLLQVLLLLLWPLGAVGGCGDNAWPVPSSVPTHPSPVPAGLGAQLALLWQQPGVSGCHHLLHPCPYPCSAAAPAAEPSGSQAGRPRGPAVLPVPGSQVRDKGHAAGLGLVLGTFPL